MRADDGGVDRDVPADPACGVGSAGLVDAAITKHGRAERRRRLLSARLVVYFVLALCLFARESYAEVLRVLTCEAASRAVGPSRG